MLVLRCTRKLLVRLKQVDRASAITSTTRLGDWYGNVLRTRHRHALIFISERSRLPVLIPARQASHLQTVFPDAVCQILTAIGIPADAIERERQEMSQIAFARTQSKSLVASLNDFSKLARADFMLAETPLEHIARRLAITPLILPFKGENPISVTRRLFS